MAEAPPVRPSWPNRLRSAVRSGSRLLRRWSLGPKAKDQLATWQELDEVGRQLADVMALPVWQVVERVTAYYKRKAELLTRVPDAPEAARLRAAIEWQILDVLFRDLRERVYHGQQAREALSKVHVTSEKL